ncbi:sigma-70 family RNA polymerase sigma factor [Marivivens sp.]|uniref:sigma-70 family RNA polymerase sigma factor n=1 Tax=Marivivens sp. TaxID=1978374 RepID=UPI0025C3C494|nr:sigma-70 family RNA polymerase sigma factor [Marivivens sp.]
MLGQAARDDQAVVAQVVGTHLVDPEVAILTKDHKNRTAVGVGGVAGRVVANDGVLATRGQDQIVVTVVVQDALMRLWKIAPEWRQGEAQVSTWLYRVVANLCTDRLRRRKRNVGIDQIAEPEDPTPSVTDRMQDDARQKALADALASLPDRQAQAVALRHLEGLGNPEIAEIMEISVEAVESLTSRGKRALAAILAGRKAELGFDDDR